MVDLIEFQCYTKRNCNESMPGHLAVVLHATLEGALAAQEKLSWCTAQQDKKKSANTWKLIVRLRRGFSGIWSRLLSFCPSVMLSGHVLVWWVDHANQRQEELREPLADSLRDALAS